MDNNHPVILSALTSSAPNSRTIELNSAALVFPGARLFTQETVQGAGKGCEQEWLSPERQSTGNAAGGRNKREIGFLNLPPGLGGTVVHCLDGGSSQAL